MKASYPVKGCFSLVYCDNIAEKFRLVENSPYLHPVYISKAQLIKKAALLETWDILCPRDYKQLFA